MDLSRTAAVLRPRRPWEAVDLGFSMVRAWWREVYSAWFLVVAPAWLVLTFLLGFLGNVPWLASLLFWWLRPLWDRVALQVLSRRLFSSPTGAGNAVRSLPGMLNGGLLLSLTFYRPDFARSYSLPAWQLEGLSGRRRRKRAQILNRELRGIGVALTAVCMFLELTTFLALIALVALVLPHVDLGELFAFLFQNDDQGLSDLPAWPFLSLLTFAAFTAIEPFYVAGGFSLYLSRRTHLEGWDVELGLRRLARRISALGRAAILVLALGSLATGGLQAQSTPQPSPVDPSGVDEPHLQGVLTEVFSGEEFRTQHEVRRWVWMGSESASAPARESPRFDLDPFLGFLRVVAWALAALAVTGLLVLVLRHGSWTTEATSKKKQAPAQEPRAPLTGLLGSDPLPGDIPGTAAQLIAAGKALAALGLLFRGAVAALVQREGAPVQDGWTEADLQRFLRDQGGNPERGRYFDLLVAAWQQGAYGRRTTREEAAANLCDLWQRHFGARP